MIHFQIPARLWEEALPLCAHPGSQLFVAGRVSEVRRRTAYIMYISFKIFFPYKLVCLGQQRLMAAHLHDPSLMKCQRAEAASSETAPVAHKTELHLRNGRHPVVFFIGRMIGPHIRIAVHTVHFRLGKRSRRWILHDILMFSVRLYESLPCKRVCIAVLRVKAFCIIKPVSFQLIKGWQHDRVVYAL